MRFFPIPVWMVVVLCAFSVACSHDLDGNTIKPRAESTPMPLDSEQVSLSAAQVSCGVENDLWATGSEDAGQRTIYRLTQKARDLQFSDDIYAGDPGFTAPLPIMGIRQGKFSASVAPTMIYENSDDGWQPTRLVH